MWTNQIANLNSFERLLIIFGSTCLLWLAIGFIFLATQTYYHLKRKLSGAFSCYDRLAEVPKEDHTSDDDRTSVITSASIVSEKSTIDDEQLQYILPEATGTRHCTYSQSSSTVRTSPLHYPSYRSLSYSQSSTTTRPLPIVMITDVDRLQTDIIDLEHFEPEKESQYAETRLRYFLNARIPQDTL